MERFLALTTHVDATFEVTGRSHAAWPHPHPDRSPLDEEYSRVSDPGKWRIIGARADAWMETLAAAELADVERDVEPNWDQAPRTDVHRSDIVVPRRNGALPLVIARSRIDGVDGAGVTIGVGDPTVVDCWIPDCGCDACDSGSQDVIDEFDEWIGGVIRGEFRRLTREVERPPAPRGFRWAVAAPDDGAVAAAEPPRDASATWALPEREVITVICAGRWSASGSFERGEVEAALADPIGWHEVSGPAWFGDDDT